MRFSNIRTQETDGIASGQHSCSARAVAVSFVRRLAGRGTRHAVQRCIPLALLFIVLPAAVAGGQGGEPVSITFESIPGMTATDYLNISSVVPNGARLGTQLQASHGVSFRSAVDYVALVRLGSGHATSGVNGIEAQARKHRHLPAHLRVLPDRLGKQRRERYNQARQLGRQCEHRKTSLGGVGQSAYAAFRFVFKDRKWIESSLKPISMKHGICIQQLSYL